MSLTGIALVLLASTALAAMSALETPEPGALHVPPQERRNEYRKAGQGLGRPLGEGRTAVGWRGIGVAGRCDDRHRGTGSGRCPDARHSLAGPRRRAATGREEPGA